MKYLLLFFLFIIYIASAQGQTTNFAAIDSRAATINAATPKELAHKLTQPYTTSLDKVRSIFRWITENIEYNTIIYQRPSRSIKNPYHIEDDPDDTSAILKPLNERVAQSVMRKRVAVCDGYSRLFKTLCDYAGIRSEIITGYARTSAGRLGKRFFSNHTWNAVYIDNSWYLLDATWASGYISFSGDFYIKNFNESYFLASPQQFIQDHYPENIYWALLPHPPALREFQYSPFKSQSFIKFKIHSYLPTSGIIEAVVGDTLLFELDTDDTEKHLLVTANPYIELGILPHLGLPTSRVLPVANDHKKVIASYVVTSPGLEQLHVIFNDRLILQYKVKIKENLANASQ